jgi:hypothetical protein
MPRNCLLRCTHLENDLEGIRKMGDPVDYGFGGVGSTDLIQSLKGGAAPFEGLLIPDAYVLCFPLVSANYSPRIGGAYSLVPHLPHEQQET